MKTFRSKALLNRKDDTHLLWLLLIACLWGGFMGTLADYYHTKWKLQVQACGVTPDPTFDGTRGVR